MYLVHHESDTSSKVYFAESDFSRGIATSVCCYYDFLVTDSVEIINSEAELSSARFKGKEIKFCNHVLASMLSSAKYTLIHSVGGTSFQDIKAIVHKVSKHSDHLTECGIPTDFEDIKYNGCTRIFDTAFDIGNLTFCPCSGYTFADTRLSETFKGENGLFFEVTWEKDTDRAELIVSAKRDNLESIADMCIMVVRSSVEIFEYDLKMIWEYFLALSKGENKVIRLSDEVEVGADSETVWLKEIEKGKSYILIGDEKSRTMLGNYYEVLYNVSVSDDYVEKHSITIPIFKVVYNLGGEGIFWSLYDGTRIVLYKTPYVFDSVSIKVHDAVREKEKEFLSSISFQGNSIIN